MNAKKIMGAVLVALLAAALFVGAGAAADASVDGTTIFFYEDLPDTYTGTWNNGANSFTLESGAMYVSNTDLPEGKYSYNDSVSIYLKKPTAVVSGITQGAGAYQVIGGTVYQNAAVEFTLASAASNKNMQIIKVLLVSPTGVPEEQTSAAPGATTQFTFDTTGKATGEYKILAVFSGAFASGTPDDVKASGVLGTFTVAKGDEFTISANVESVIVNQPVTVTITGKPGEMFMITGDFSIVSNGTVTNDNKGVYTLSNTGKAVLYMAAADTGSKKITVDPVQSTLYEKKSVTISVKKGSITAATEKANYYVGDKVKISGTATAGLTTLNVFIEGTNIPLQQLTTVTITVNGDGEWEEELTADELKAKKKGSSTTNNQPLDAGTYTLYITQLAPTGDDVKTKNFGTYGTAALVLKQPFITVTDAPAVAVKGADYIVKGTAEATDELAVYIFGTNFYAATDGKKNVTTNVLTSNPVSFEGTEFTIEFEIPDEGMAGGQYFMVIQHPMYDKEFNIKSDADGNIMLGTESLFNVYERQTSNAAQALCDAIETENIDDMYVKLSFVVAAPSSTINPIPSEITQGSKLTVSGTTNLPEGELVTVELLSTAFAAVPKNTVGSASFIALTTTTDENGNWEVTFDTTGLNVDEYTVSVAVAELDSTSTKINIIEGAPTEQPTTTPTTQPTQTEQPTTPPTTPGFGALAALAGLGAVAVLLLRRE